MAKRYSKFKSAFILKKEHSEVENGSIMERDWVTIGSVNKIEPGKKPVYGEGNFIFTDSSYVDYRYKKRFASEEDVIEDTQEAVSPEDLFDILNDSKDLSDFVYYGSAVELIRATIDKIIREFPISIKASKFKLFGYYDNGVELTEDNSNQFVIDNPFNVDFLTKFIGTDMEDRNVLRYIYLSANNYTCNGEDITDYSVKSLYEEIGDRYRSYHDFICDNDGEKICTITINNKFVIYVYADGFDLLYSTPNEDLIILPKPSIIESYFNGLNFIERRLLNRNTSPIYTCKFIYKVEGQYSSSVCTFPSDGYSIDVSSPSFLTYVDKLIEVGNIYDLSKSNVINGKLVHESLKTLDWSSRHINAKNTDEEYKEGLNYMESFFNVLGRAFDDIKVEIDTLNQGDKFNLKNYNPNTLSMIEEGGYKGWEFFKLFKQPLSFNVNKDKWYKNLGNQKLTTKYTTDEFIKRLLHFNTSIISRKGTLEAIRQVMALFSFDHRHYNLKEVYYRFDNITNTEKFIELHEDIQFYGLENVYSEKTYKLPHRLNDGVIEPFLGDKSVDDENLYFHSKGSWVKFSKDHTNKFDYLETQSYLKSVNHIEDLTLINANDIQVDEPVYVVNVDMFHNHFPNGQLTHYFHLTDNYNPQHISSWEPVDKTHRLWDNVNYLNSIINDTTDNNPHVGFGKYDMGKYFIDSLVNPFKYYIERYGIEDDELLNRIENFSMAYSELSTDSKILVQQEIEPYNQEQPYRVGQVFYLNHQMGKSFYECIEADDEYGLPFEKRKSKYVPYIPDIRQYKSNYFTFINSKVLLFENKVDNEHYKAFLKKSVLPYLYQVIPSTTTLIVLNV